MQTGTDHITLRQSASATIAWLFEVDGEPIDFTTWTGARMHVRERQDQGSTLLVAVTSLDGIELAADGTITATLTEVLLADIPPGSYHWDLRLVDADGNVDYPLAGTFTIVASVTTPTDPEPEPEPGP